MAEALAWLRKRAFGLVLLDISLPERTGLDLLKTIKQEQPRLPVLVLSAYAEGPLCRARNQGRRRRLPQQAKRDGPADGRDPQGCERRQISDAGAGRADRTGARYARRSRRARVLSDREFEILKLIARGLSLKDIGERLHISAKTVTTYRARILEKTGLVNNAELTRYMVENNLLD